MEPPPSPTSAWVEMAPPHSPTSPWIELAAEEHGLLRAAEEGGTQEARALFGAAGAPAAGRCLGRSHCLVCVGVAALIAVSTAGAAGVWMTTRDAQDLRAAAPRGLSAPAVAGGAGGHAEDEDEDEVGGGAAGDAGGAPAAAPCDGPLCQAEELLDEVKRWDGWGQMVPFLVTDTDTSTTATGTSTTTATATATTTSTDTGTTTTFTTTCMLLEEGDACYKEVLDVLYDLRDNPDSRENLSVWSSFEEVQTWLRQNDGRSSCLSACECEVAPADSRCYSSLVYATGPGIREHPEWYPGLTEESSTQDFQEYLWKNVNETECSRPCKAFPRSDPSLFCWSVARQWSYEADIMRAQLAAGAGIFGCDGSVVVSEEAWNVGWGPGGRIGEVNTLTFPGAPVGVSQDGTAGNAQLFMNAWDAILDRTLILDFDWGIKVDPDAVVVAARLRDHVRDQTGSNVFVRNCMGIYGNWDLMYGSLEVISRGGLQVLKEGRYRCRSELNWYSWGEDMFLDRCLVHLGVGHLGDYRVVSDGLCGAADCNDGWAAAFHPFKDSGAWTGCWSTVAGKMGGPPRPPLP